MQAGDFSAVLMTSTVITGFLAWLLLKERFTLIDVDLALSTLAGVIFIARPSFIFGDSNHTTSKRDGTTTLGVVAALGSALFLAAC